MAIDLVCSPENESTQSCLRCDLVLTTKGWVQGGAGGGLVSLPPHIPILHYTPASTKERQDLCFRLPRSSREFEHTN
jgi:hypothetical protein